MPSIIVAVEIEVTEQTLLRLTDDAKWRFMDKVANGDTTDAINTELHGDGSVTDYWPLGNADE